MTDGAPSESDAANELEPKRESTSWPTLDEFDYLIMSRGWAVFDNVYDTNAVSQYSTALQMLTSEHSEVQKDRGCSEDMDGTSHCLLSRPTVLYEILAALPLRDYVTRYFNGSFILNSFGGVVNNGQDTSYLFKPHRDVRSFAENARLMLNMLVMLDDFTEANGATRLLAGSHRLERIPPNKIFEENAESLKASAGSIALWDSNVVHAGTVNRSGKPRACLTIGLARPYIKPIIDLTKMIDPNDAKNLPETARQLIGYHSLPASSLEEFYQPAVKRTYRE